MLDKLIEMPIWAHILINLWGVPLYFLLIYLIDQKKIRLNKRINNKQTLFIYCMIIVAFGYVVFMD